jgi:hypothetical protein
MWDLIRKVLLILHFYLNYFSNMELDRGPVGPKQVVDN